MFVHLSTFLLLLPIYTHTIAILLLIFFGKLHDVFVFALYKQALFTFALLRKIFKFDDFVSRNPAILVIHFSSWGSYIMLSKLYKLTDPSRFIKQGLRIYGITQGLLGGKNEEYK